MAEQDMQLNDCLEQGFPVEDWTSDIRRLYEIEGLTLSQIAEIKGKSRQAVHQRLHKMGADFRRKSIPDDKFQQAKTLCDERKDMTLKQISDMLGICASTLSQRFKKEGFKKQRATRCIAKRDDVVADYVSGMSTNKVAEKHGISATTVKNYVVGAGYEMRPKGKFERTETMRQRQSQAMLRSYRGENDDGSDTLDTGPD